MAFPAQFNLADLDGSNGFVLNGIDELILFSLSVSSAGDVNGDGFNDVIIGAPVYRGQASGKSYVVFGSVYLEFRWQQRLRDQRH